MHDVKRTIDAELSHLRMTPAHKALIAARIDRYEEGNMNRKWKLSTSLTATLAAALLLATLAYAATQSNLLARLFPHSTPTPQAEHLLTPVGRSQSQDGCKLTIDEYLLDGTTLYLHWTAESSAAEPLLLLPGTIEAPHYMLSGYGESDTIGPAAGVLLGDEVNGKPLKRSHSGTSRINLSSLATLDKPFDVTLTALFMRPVAPIVKEADMTDRESSPTLMLMPDFVDDIGFTLLLNKFEWQDDHTWNISRPDGVGLSMTYVTGTDGNSDLYNQCWDESGNHLTAKDYELQGYASLAAEIPVTFTVIPDAANITHAGIDTPLNFSFEAFDVEVTKANFTATSLDVRFLVDVKRAGELSAGDWGFEVRPDGRALPYALEQAQEESEDWPRGRFAVSIQGETSEATPSFITVVPYLESNGDYANRTVLDAYTMTIPLKVSP